MSEGMRLEQVLHLVGALDDSEGTDSSRERFRDFLNTSVSTVGVLRDYVDTCLRNSGPQFNRALQDLINHAGSLTGFDVEYGRYQGRAGSVGHDGLWRTGDLAIAVEVKTTDAYTIQTATLIGYIDALISAGSIKDWDHAIGVYVVGRADSGLSQLENAIIAERRTHQLRIATASDILSLAEMVQEKYITHDEAVTLLRPTGVHVTSYVDMLTRIIAESAEASIESTKHVSIQNTPLTTIPEPLASKGQIHLLTPVSDDDTAPAEQIIRQLLDSGQYVFGDRTPGRKELKPGDRICFYQSGTGVVAEAEVSRVPQLGTSKVARDPERFPWVFGVRNVRYFFDSPIVIDASLRSRLEAFNGRDPSRSWAWYVQGTSKVTPHDFEILTGRE